MPVLTLLLVQLLALGYDPAMAAEFDPGEASEILHQASEASEEAHERLLEILHRELRELAGQAMFRERDDHTLQPTALVHEVWIKLFEPGNPDFADRRHFLAVSSRVMRQVLVDHARARRRVKRGGLWQRVNLEAAQGELAAGEQEGFDLVALDGALDELRSMSPRQAQVVELRFFGGLSVEETASALELSERSVAREWRFARAWLANRLGSS
jgi:RNA polymerase sigma factor (TIGR02999 family)